jgi:hypothetical protein
MISERYLDDDESKKIEIDQPNGTIEAQKKSNLEDNTKETTQQKEQPLKITIASIDCDTECSRYKNQELNYCEQICGISSLYEQSYESNDSSLNCEKEKGLQRDYCLKDLAIEKENFKTCDQISDSGLKKACQNRITEDLLEKEFP